MATIGLILDGNSNTGNIVYAGQQVTGRVHINASRQIQTRGIRLELRGNGKVHWSEGSGDDRKSYNGKEKYIDMDINIIGSRNNAKELTIQPGAHRFPFSFALPPGLPQSFESKTGRIRYKLKAVIDRPMNFDDTTEILLTVVRQLDLNKEAPHLREPMQMHQQGSAEGCCGCCVSGFTEMNVTVNRGCFAPGETIRVDGEIYNRTDSEIMDVTISFVQDIQYISQNWWTGNPGHSTNLTKVLAKAVRTGFRQERDCFNNISFPVSSMPPSRLDGCNIINIRYYIEVRANFASFSYVNTLCGIIIGNVPLQRFHEQIAITSQPIPGRSATAPDYPPPAYDTVLHTGANFNESNAWATEVPEIAQVHKY